MLHHRKYLIAVTFAGGFRPFTYSADFSYPVGTIVTVPAGKGSLPARVAAVYRAAADDCLPRKILGLASLRARRAFLTADRSTRDMALSCKYCCNNYVL